MFDPNRLENAEVAIDDILLDPNNPRLLDLDPTARRVPDNRISEPRVQQHVFDQMLQRALDVGPLKRSIRQIGFLKMDKIVVRQLESGQYVVVEGNRRVAAIKWLLQDHDTARDTLGDELLEQLRQLEVLMLTTPAEDASKDQWLLQGLRHISGVKAWGPYQRAKALETLVQEMGYDPREAAEAVGLGPTQTARSLDALRALEAMQEDPQYGDFATPDMYSYFVEVMRRPVLRDFLGWQRGDHWEESGFYNYENLSLFYSWITPQDDEEPKIKRAIDVRPLAKIISNEDALEELMRADGTLVRAIALTVEAEHLDWERHIRRAIEALQSIPSNALESLTTPQREVVGELISISQLRLNQARMLQESLGTGDQGVEEEGSLGE